MLDWFDYHGHMCIAFEMLGLSVFDFLVNFFSKKSESEKYESSKCALKMHSRRFGVMQGHGNFAFNLVLNCLLN
jgi:hypothetical protein